MRVRMTTQISGTRDGVEWPRPGNYVEVPDDEARELISAGDAVDPAGDQDRGWQATETGVVPPSELREGDNGAVVSSQHDLDVWPPYPAVQSGPNALQALPGMPQTTPSLTLTAEGTIKGQVGKAAETKTVDMAAEAERVNTDPVVTGADVDPNVVEGTNDAGIIPKPRTRKG